MTGEEQGKKLSDNHSERPANRVEKPQTSQETAENSVIDGQQKQHQQLHRQALESNPNTHTGSSRIENPNNDFESIQILEAIPDSNEKRVVAERAKPTKESDHPVKTFDRPPDAPEHRDSNKAEHQATKNQPEKVAATAHPKLQQEIPRLDKQTDLASFVSLPNKADTFQTIKQDFSKRGESFLDVAKRLAPAQLSPADVEEWVNQSVKRDGNNVHDPNQVLEAGTRVTLRPFQKSEAAISSDLSLYTVQPGDSLWKIAKEHGVPENEIPDYLNETVKLNSIEHSELIRPGDQLRLPGGKNSDQSVTPRPEPTLDPKPIVELNPDQLEPPPEPTQEKPTSKAFDFASKEAEKQFHNLERLMDRHYDDGLNFQETGFPKEVHDAIGQTTGREHLLELAKKHHCDGDLLNETIETIEDRIARKEVSPEEVKKTYEQVERLLETESNVGVTEKQREILAQQILEHTANPKHIDQGEFNTCNVCTVECRCFSRTPSAAAKLISDIALKGEYQCNVPQDDGTFKAITVEQTPAPFNKQTLDVPAKDGNRSYASQIFQVTAVNIHYKAEGKGTWYEQRCDSNDPKDNGERLHKPDGTIEKNPALPDYAFVEIHNSITGRNDAGFLLEAPSAICGPDKLITHITSPAELEQRLQDIEKSGNFPVIIGVDCANEPFWSDGSFGGAGGAGDDLGGGHVVTVTGIEHGPPIRIKVDNQWSSLTDHQSDVTAMTSRQLYFSMLDPIAAADELTQVIRNDREKGHRDSWNELEYERLRIVSNRKIDRDGLPLPEIPTREIEMDVINTLSSAFSAHTEQPDDWQKPAILSKLGQVTAHLPPESQIRIEHEEARLGLISHDEYKRKLIDFGKFTATSAATDQQCKEFDRLIAEFPESERATILAQL